MTYKYDLFVSYATANKDIADYVVSKIEARGFKCFIAPRNIATGADYAREIVSAISNSVAVLLIFSTQSDKSGYVLREINSAVSRNKTIIPLKIEQFVPSEAMEFYLGVTHWLDAYPKILDIHLDAIERIIHGISGNATIEASTIKVEGPLLLKISELGAIGYDYTKLTMKEIEIDYVCIPSDKFEINDEVEGTFVDWQNSAKEYEEDTSITLVVKDTVVGYCDVYPVTPQAYEELISGKVIIRDTMIDLFALGGEFDAYIAMMAILPDYVSQANYLLMFDWLFKHLSLWKKDGIIIRKLGLSVYSDMLEKFAVSFGFKYVGRNPAKGKIFEAVVQDLKSIPAVVRRYGNLDF